MKKYLPTLLILVTILSVGGMVFAPHTAMAQNPLSNGITAFFTGVTEDVASTIIAGLSNFVLMLTAKFVYLTGIFLSLSINITLHIKEILEGTQQFPGGLHTSIDTIWTTVRDLSSIFIIFSLLYLSIMTILGQSKTGLNQLIVQIFLAGILINFSMFFVKIAVDGSNLVSLQFYNAIAPDTAGNLTAQSAFSDGGLSNVFMQSLKLPTIYGDKGFLQSANVMSALGLATVGGIILMVTAGFSFLAAGIAFTIRTAVILFIMALSPLYFAGMIFPDIKAKVSDKLRDLLLSQLMFMPIYLFLMYIALKLISDPMFTQIFNVPGSNSFGTLQLGVILQYTIAIIFINAPLVAAIQFGGMGMKWAPTGLSISKGVGGFLGRNVVGRVARGLGKSFDATAASGKVFGNETLFKKGASVLGALNISQGIRGTLDKGEKGKYGGSQSLKDIKDEAEKRTKEIRKISLKQELEDAIAKNKQDEVRKILEKMSDAEIAGLSAKTLKNPNVIPHLSGNVYKNVDKGDKNDDEKVEIAEARAKALTAALASATLTGNSSIAKSMMKNMSGSDLEKMLESVPSGTPVPDAFIEHLKPSHLKDMENVDDNLRKEIGRKIQGWSTAHGGRNHPALDHVNKNPTLWT